MYEHEAGNSNYPTNSVVWQQQLLTCQRAIQAAGRLIHRLVQAPNAPPPG